MSELNFALTLLIALIGPIVALRYLQPILIPVLDSLCTAPLPGAAGAHFWLRTAYVLAVAGTLVLALLFGNFEGEPLAAVHRALLLTAAGCFVSISSVARRVWLPVGRALTVPPKAIAAGED